MAPLRVLCVDDEVITLRLVSRLLEGMGLVAVTSSSATGALERFDAERFDLVITDVRMPEMDGLAFLAAIRARDPQVPVIVATGHATLDNATRVLREGATGMIVKPFTGVEFTSEVTGALERARLRHDALQFRFVTPILDGVALALSAAIESRHLETGLHCHQLGVVGERMATILGLPENERTTIRIGGFLHDVGKIAIADRILLKPGALTPDEYAEMQRHSEIGAAIVNTHEAMSGIARIVRHHHERWDGAGYPDRLAGAAIPLGARIISVVDAFSAMTNDRVYRRAVSADEARAELRRHAGTQFDPSMVEVHEAVLDADTPGADELGARRRRGEPAA
jgi:response regulator RpfG family c-di-GMP phosphodiesterase